MARYGEGFRKRMVARMLPPESANVGELSRETGVAIQTLERWRDKAQFQGIAGRSWSAAARLDAMITVAALDEAGKSAWCQSMAFIRPNWSGGVKR